LTDGAFYPESTRAMAENYPDNLLYTKDHEWCAIEGGVAKVGITWHAQNALGDVVFCELPEVGSSLSQGTAFGVVESVKAVSDLYAPLSGKVVERNDKVVATPDILNSDSYDAGWMIKMEISNQSEVEKLLSAADYKKLIAEGA
jgi:glycine cleavage system H protein